LSTTIRLECDDPSLRTALQEWLDAGGLEPPDTLCIAVAIGKAAPPTTDTRTVFRQPGVAIRTGPPQGGVHIWWEVAPAAAELAPGAKTARVVLSPAAVARFEECSRTFLMTVLIFLLRRTAWHHVHGATAIAPSGTGWLIAGNSHAGKSTTAALLASSGWPVGTDDVAFLAPAGNRVAVQGYHGPIALRSGAYELLGRAGGVHLPRRGKMGYRPEDLGGAWAPRVEPSVILFTSVGDDETTAAPLGGRETMAELVRWSAWVVLEPEIAQEHLDLIARLAGQARSFRVRLGRDLFDRPTKLAELVA